MAAGRGVVSKDALPMKSQSRLSVWIRLRNSQRQSDETKSPVRSFTQLLGWSLLSRTGENRQLFRSAKMTPGSRFLTTPTPLLTASDFHQTKKPTYHTQIVQYTGHSGYSLRRWYSWSRASAFQCQSHPDTPVSKVTHCCFLYSHLTIQCALYQTFWCGFFNQGFLSGHRHCRVRKPYFLMTIDTNITSPQDFLY